MAGQLGTTGGDEQARWLKEASTSVKRNAFFMKRALVRIVWQASERWLVKRSKLLAGATRAMRASSSIDQRAW